MVIEFVKKRKQFKKIVEDIKSIKIQGARNIARAALKAYLLIPSKRSKKRLLLSRPTEPMMRHVLKLASKFPEDKILNHFDDAQKTINAEVFKLLNKQEVIFTHCHSTNVLQALLFAKSKQKIFSVRNTETRPLYQGRKTAKELGENNIKITTFVDSGMRLALLGDKKNKKVTRVFLGADALTKKGVINKIGSGAIAELARSHNIPVYIIADSWKYTPKDLVIEKRELNEVWNKAPKEVKIENPAFEFVDKKYITKIISEYGTQNYGEFIREKSHLDGSF